MLHTLVANAAQIIGFIIFLGDIHENSRGIAVCMLSRLDNSKLMGFKKNFEYLSSLKYQENER